MSELISALMRVNLVLAAAILVVLLLRTPTRRAFGARIAYALWLIPPFAAAMCFAPARVVHVTLPAAFAETFAPAPVAAPLVAAPPFWPVALAALWGAGALVYFTVLALRQARFRRALGRLTLRAELGARVFGAESAIGPAVIGLLRPLIVTPVDFDRRFSDEEQTIMLAHERAHLAQGDPWINAAVAGLQCLAWFNPLVHWAQRALRTDQELACDAAVLARTQSRRPYAEAILKSQISQPAPFGCAWPSQSPSSLKERIAMLKTSLPSPTQRVIGVSLIAAASFAACAVAWSAQPPRIEVTTIQDADAVEHAAAKEERALARLAALAPQDDAALAPVAYAAPHYVPAGAPEAAAGPVGAPVAIAGPVGAAAPAAPAPVAAPAAPGAAVAPEPPTPMEADDADDDADLQNLSPEAEARIQARVARALARERSDVSAEERARIMAQVERGLAEARRVNSPEFQAQLRARVDRAMIQERVALANAHEAMERTARADRVRIHNRDVEMTPEMRAELRAISAATARMGEISALNPQQRAEMDRLRDEIETHANRLRDLADHAPTAERRHPAARVAPAAPH